jgi:hypothetical protein
MSLYPFDDAPSIERSIPAEERWPASGIPQDRFTHRDAFRWRSKVGGGRLVPERVVVISVLTFRLDRLLLPAVGPR